MKEKKLLLEVCANGVQSGLNAQEAGADRIELCEMLEAGGITPGIDYIQVLKEKLSIPIHVLIRPRAGDFFYSNTDFNVIRHEVRMCKSCNVDGVVIGILKNDLTVYLDRCRQLIELAHPLKVTFHRAFDLVKDPFQSLEELIELGFDRILTSGQKPNCLEGAEMISRLVKQASGRIIVMPGGGITEENIREVVKKTGADEFHFSAKVTLPDGDLVSDLDRIRKIRKIAEEAFYGA